MSTRLAGEGRLTRAIGLVLSHKAKLVQSPLGHPLSCAAVRYTDNILSLSINDAVRSPSHITLPCQTDNFTGRRILPPCSLDMHQISKTVNAGTASHHWHPPFRLHLSLVTTKVSKKFQERCAHPGYRSATVPVPRTSPPRVWSSASRAVRKDLLMATVAGVAFASSLA